MSTPSSTPANCASCNTADAPRYQLSCHDKKSHYCRNCLTETWCNAKDELIHCPHHPCGKGSNFMPLVPLSQILHFESSFYDIERIEKIHEQPEIMNNLIGFTREEAAVALQHLYSMFEDQILDPVLLGGAPGQLTLQAEESFGANVSSNPFYQALLNELTAPAKMMATPSDLEEDLNVVLTRSLYAYITRHFRPDLQNSDASFEEKVAVVDAASDFVEVLPRIQENWIEIIRKWVDLLACHHLGRFASLEGIVPGN